MATFRELLNEEATEEVFTDWWLVAADDVNNAIRQMTNRSDFGKVVVAVVRDLISNYRENHTPLETRLFASHCNSFVVRDWGEVPPVSELETRFEAVAAINDGYAPMLDADVLAPISLRLVADDDGEGLRVISEAAIWW